MFDKRIKDEFWSVFGKYMALSPSASGDKINWINYKTGIKHVQFIIAVDSNSASIAIILSNPDIIVRQRLFKQLKDDKHLLSGYTNNDWHWHFRYTGSQNKSRPGNEFISDEDIGSEGGSIPGEVSDSGITQVLKGVNVYIRSDWPAIISFLKPLLIGLDRFWVEQKELYAYISN